jgi:C4-dicarboxylate transporter DctM subunit
MFAAVSGSNSATAATIGRLVKDEMAERGISNSFAAATVAAGGIVGIIIPPSVIFIVYGVTVNVPSVDLFIGGFLPGVLMTALVLVIASARTRRKEPGVGIRSMSLATISRTAVGAWAGFVAIGMIFGGLYFGLLSPTEAAGVVTIYCMVMAILAWRKERRFSASYFVSILLRSAGITGIIVPLVAFSVIFQEVTSIMGLPEFVQALVENIGAQYGTALAILVMMGIIVAVGALTESVAVVLILGPIFAPVAIALGIDPVHWGVAFVIGTAIGFITPPYGLNLFVVSAVCGAPYSSVVRNVLPYVAPLVLLWAFITFSPWTTSVLRIMLQ